MWTAATSAPWPATVPRPLALLAGRGGLRPKPYEGRPLLPLGPSAGQPALAARPGRGPVAVCAALAGLSAARCRRQPSSRRRATHKEYVEYLEKRKEVRKGLFSRPWHGKKRSQGKFLPRRKVSKEEEEEEPVPIADGPAPIYNSAAQAVPTGEERKRSVDWKNPGLNVLEKAALAAEAGWDEERWAKAANEDKRGMEAHTQLLPDVVKERMLMTTPPDSIKEFIENEQLGRRRPRKWPKGHFRPKQFTGSDPMHNGLLDSLDDGNSTTIGRYANRVHEGYMRLRCMCHPAGLKGQPGVFPLPERPEVAFIGASNVGKSSLLNAMTKTRNIVPAADRPGVTRTIGWYKCSELPIDIVDLPGYGRDFAKANFGPLLTKFMRNRKAMRMMYIVIDARTGIRYTDWQWLKELGDAGPEKFFILSRSDMVKSKALAKIATMVLEDIKCVPRANQRLIMVSSRQGQGMHDLRQHISGRALAWEREAAKFMEQQAASEEAGKDRPMELSEFKGWGSRKLPNLRERALKELGRELDLSGF